MNHYEVLGVERGVGRDELRQAWDCASQGCAPERVAGLDPDIRALAARKYERLQEAWRILGDDESRERYDSELGDEGTTPREAPPLPPPSTPPPLALPPDDLIRRIEDGIASFEEELRRADPKVRWKSRSHEDYDAFFEGYKSIERSFVYLSTHDLLGPEITRQTLERYREQASHQRLLLHRRYSLLVMSTLRAEPESEIRELVRRFNDSGPAVGSTRARDLSLAALFFLRSGEFFIPGPVSFHPCLRRLRLPAIV